MIIENKNNDYGKIEPTPVLIQPHITERDKG